MQRFYHADLQQLDSFAARLSTLNGEYADKSFDLDKRCEALLKALITFFDDSASAERRLAVDQSLVYLTTARDGVDPRTLEVLHGGRRALIRRSLHHVLTTTTEIVLGALTENRSRLNRSQELIEQCLLTALQSGAIADADLDAAATGPSDARTAWSKVMEDGRLRQVARQAKMNIHPQDVNLLVMDAAARIR